MSLARRLDDTPLLATRVVWVISAIWATVLATLNWWRWASYHANSDFALFVQTVASGFPSFHNTVEDGNHFAVHFSPIYEVFSPFVNAAHSVVPLFIGPAIAGALVGPGIFLLAHKVLPASRAVGLACVALLYPSLVGLIFGDPFENVFAPAATVWLLYALEARKFVIAGSAAIVALSIKEDQGIFLALAGLFLAWRYRNDRPRMLYCLGISIFSVLTFAAYFAILRPHAGSAAGGWSPMRFYRWSNAWGHVEPWYSPGRVMYLLEVFTPLLFLPFRSSMIVLAVAPFAEILASPFSILFTNGTHYAGVWIGYVLVAYVYGLARVTSARRVKRLIALSAAICSAQLAFASPTHWRVHLSLLNQHDRALTAILATLPRNASISTYEEAYAHLGFYPNAVMGIRGRPSFIVIDTTRSTSYFVPVLAVYVKTHPAYVKIRSEDGINVYALHASGERPLTVCPRIPPGKGLLEERARKR